MKPRIHALIPCAGNGSRAGGEQPKQYRLLLGKAVVQHALDALRALGSQLNSLNVVLAAGDTQFALTQPAARHAREQVHAVGGATRAGTVRNGLHALLGQPDTAPDDWVLVHDAARCLVTTAQIAQLIAACEGDAVGGLLALPLADTLKRSAGARVQATVPRDGLWLAQTPQMFRIGMLLDALQRAGDGVTDEAGAIEAMGLQPLLVPGSAQNFKLTYPEDFTLAEAILRSRLS